MTPAKAGKNIGGELGRNEPKGAARLAVGLAKAEPEGDAWFVLDGAVCSKKLNDYGNFLVCTIERERTPQDERRLIQLAATPELVRFLSAYIELAEHHGEDDAMPGLPDCLARAKELRAQIGGAS